MNTKEKILARALELFNIKGIEYVGIRELATDMGLHVGNITYYFPTKDNLVEAISFQLREKNNEVFRGTENLDLMGFLEFNQKLFDNHYQFRCLMKSFVHQIEQHPELAAKYKVTEKKRFEALEQNLRSLCESGHFKKLENETIQFLKYNLSLINRFWVSEASISFRDKTPEWQKRHYLQLISNLLLPYCTARGKKQVLEFLESLGTRHKSENRNTL